VTARNGLLWPAKGKAHRERYRVTVRDLFPLLKKADIVADIVLQLLLTRSGCSLNW